MKLVVLLLAVVAIILLLTTELTQALKVDYFVKADLGTATPFLDSSGFGYLVGIKFSSPESLFVKKLSASGTTLWETPISGFNANERFITEDSSHNIYISGSNGQERFIALKVSPSGVVLWRKEVPCQLCTVSSIAVVSGNLYVTGTFSGSFGLSPTFQITGLGIYSARLSLANGNFISGVQQAVVGQSSGPYRGSTNANGQTCTIGTYDGTLKIGNLPSISGTFYFLLKTNSNGQPAYLKATGFASDVSIDSAGRCYLVGNEFTRVDSSGGSTLVQTKFPPTLFIRCLTDKCFIAGITADWLSLTSQQTYGIFDFPISQSTYTTFPFIAEISLEGNVRDAIFERTSGAFLSGLSAISNQVMLVEGGSGTRRWDLKTQTSNNELLVSRFTQAPNVCQSCPSGQKCCHQNSGAYVCYDPNVRGCAEGVLCQENYLACGAHCYAKGQFTCTSGWGLCGKGLLKCSTGGVCYNPTTHKCIDQVLVCKINEERCFGWNLCYDPTKSVCCREGVVPKNPGCAPCC